MPQKPQCALEVERFASQPSVAFALQFSNPPLHMRSHTPEAQSDVALGRFGQLFVQRPQCNTSDVMSVSHPSALTLLQSP